MCALVVHLNKVRVRNRMSFCHGKSLRVRPHDFQVWLWRAHTHDLSGWTSRFHLWILWLEWTSRLHLQILCSELCSSFLRPIILEGWQSLLAVILTWCRIRGLSLWEHQLWELNRGGELGGQALVGMWSCPAEKELQQWGPRESHSGWQLAAGIPGEHS